MDKSSTHGTGSGDQFAESLWKFGKNLGIVTWHGGISLFRKIKESPFKAIVFMSTVFFAIRFFAYKGMHLRFLMWIWPSLFSGKFLNWLCSFPAQSHFRFLSIGAMWIYIICLGAIALNQKRKLKESFESIGLVNRFGATPTLIAKANIDEYRELLLLKANSIGVDQFESKKASLEATFGKKIERIQAADDRKNVKIIFSNKELPEFINFEELLHKKDLTGGNFFIGESMSGMQTGKLTDFPHMLIAGTTGAGKSVFFKQTLIGLLRSTNHIQMYFIDLKRGLEAADFKACPNVAVAKNSIDALGYLERIESEMNKRFKYLESKGFKSIVPKRDHKDLILVAVDEAAELYAEKFRSDKDYEVFRRSQEITDSISRLGRAAGIHLILATQKVNKESINTTIQENISARMCFRMNTLQGSLQVLGNNHALDLPDIAGRGIFQKGNQQFQVQVPFICAEQIQSECKSIALEFHSGKRSLFQPMMGTPDTTAPNEFRHEFIDQKME